MNKIYHSVLIFLLFGTSSLSFSQTGSTVFNDTVLHEIRIQFPYSSWFDSLQMDYQLNLTDEDDTLPDREFLCDMAFDGVSMDSIGMRQRGNYSNFSAPLTSSNGLKKPFKLEFNAFKNQEFDGLKRLNLNNGTDDPSFVREALIYKLIRGRGLPACRTAYAKLYINDAYWGLYELIENVDKTFLKDHFGGVNNDGNLYKTDRNAGVDLKWQGTDPEAYEGQGLLLKTNESANDWSKFLNFVRIINYTDNAKMEEELSSVFDVEGYLDILAVEVLCYSWDSYWGGGNNFYLYEHPDGKIRWIPWDFNETFTTTSGILGVFLPRESDIFLSTRFDQRPLIKAIFSVRKWQDLYLDKVCDLCTNQYWSPLISPQLRKWQALIRQPLLEDLNALGSMQSFDLSLTEDMDNAYNVPGKNAGFNIKVPALLPYISKQRTWAVNQIKKQEGNCALTDAEPSEYPITMGPNPATEIINIFWDQIATDVYRLSVYNSYGDIVINSGWIVNDEMYEELDISQLPKGFYLVRKLDADGFWGVSKFIKQ